MGRREPLQTLHEFFSEFIHRASGAHRLPGYPLD
jgi:hypothetical protein